MDHLTPDQILRRIAATQQGLITAVQAICAGLDHVAIRARVRRGEWRALARGVYLIDADRYDEPLPDPVWWRAAVLAHGPGVCLVGRTGVEALGVQGVPGGYHPIELALVGGGSRAPRSTSAKLRPLAGWNRGVVVRQLPVQASEVVTHDGLPVRAAFYTVIDAALLVDRGSALAILDSALHLNVLTRDMLALAVGQAGHRRGIVALRDLARIADGRAESPL
jgi:hypothetical protein